MIIKYKFSEPENTACFACNHVTEAIKPILLAFHISDEENEYWQFLCGDSEHNNSNIKIITLLNATKIDPSINDLSEMPIEMGASRKSVDSEWKMFSVPNE